MPLPHCSLVLQDAAIHHHALERIGRVLWQNARRQAGDFHPRTTRVLTDLGFSIDGASIINCDRDPPSARPSTPVSPSRRPSTSSGLRAAEFLRDLVNRGVISVEHLPGVVMLADLLTKAASRAIFTGLIKQLDNFSCPLSSSFVPREPGTRRWTPRA